jgi:hypothetical protein
VLSGDTQGYLIGTRILFGTLKKECGGIPQISGEAESQGGQDVGFFDSTLLGKRNL